MRRQVLPTEPSPTTTSFTATCSSAISDLIITTHSKQIAHNPLIQPMSTNNLRYFILIDFHQQKERERSSVTLKWPRKIGTMLAFGGRCSMSDVRIYSEN